MREQIQKVFGIRSVESLSGLSAKGPDRITVDYLSQIIERREKVTLLDVRTPDEHARRRIPGSIMTSVNNLQYMEEYSYEGEIVLYCTAGVRSYNASKALAARGIKGVTDLIGGIKAWEASGRSVESDA